MTVNYPQNKISIGTVGAHGGKRWKFKKTEQGRTLVVVAEVKNKDCWLATAYYED